MLKVLVTGFPYSGTSFICHLISKMGFSPGPSEELSRASNQGDWDRWENKRMKRCLRRISSLGFGKAWHIDELVRIRMPKQEDQWGRTLRRYAKENGVEVFKDNYIPLVYRVFLPCNAKCVVTRRDPEHLYRVRGRFRDRLQEANLKISWEDFMRAYNYYYELVGHMAKEIPTLIVGYDDFKQDFDSELSRITRFLGIGLGKLDKNNLRAVFRPRGER